jgi:hypothetical protein
MNKKQTRKLKKMFAASQQGLSPQGKKDNQSLLDAIVKTAGCTLIKSLIFSIKLVPFVGPVIARSTVAIGNSLRKGLGKPDIRETCSKIDEWLS